MRRKAFTLIELLVVVAIIALLISILLPSLARARELSKRTVCAANIKGIGTAIATYANENEQLWPCAPYDKTVTPAAGQIPWAALDGKMGGGTPNRCTVTTELAGQAPGTSRSFWMLIRDGATAPKQFICPSTDGAQADDNNPGDYYDFGPANACTANVQTAYKQLSYGLQVPFGSNGRPTTDRDPRMALAADKGPYGAAWDGLQTAPNLTPGCTSVSSPDDWRPWNSPNHGGQGDGEGQNILFSDFHAEFLKRPCEGIGLDNIYTHWTGAGTPVPGTMDAMIVKGIATHNMAPFDDKDTVIYP